MIYTTELTSPSSAALQWIKYYLKRNISKSSELLMKSVENKTQPMYLDWCRVWCKSHGQCNERLVIISQNWRQIRDRSAALCS